MLMSVFNCHFRMGRLPNLIFSQPFLKLARKTLERGIMTSSSRAEKAMEELKTNAYYGKYADKIAKLQQTSPEEFLSRVDTIEKKTAPQKPAVPSGATVTDGKFTQLLNPKKPLKSVEGSSEQPLEKIMKIEPIRDKPTEEVREIWRQYHLQKNFISAVIPAEDYDILTTNTKKFPTFIFPLPRSQGYEFILAQFEGNCVHFTPLLYYQVHKENAPECLTITHYTELKDGKGIVLMRGEYDKNVIDLKEAQCLANQLQLYYVRPSPEKLALLEVFTKKPDEFKHMDLVKQIESLTLS